MSNDTPVIGMDDPVMVVLNNSPYHRKRGRVAAYLKFPTHSVFKVEFDDPALIPCKFDGEHVRKIMRLRHSPSPW